MYPKTTGRVYFSIWKLLETQESFLPADLMTLSLFVDRVTKKIVSPTGMSPTSVVLIAVTLSSRRLRMLELAMVSRSR